MDVRTYPRSTRDDFLRIVERYPDARVEIDAVGTITVTPPAGAASSNRSARLTRAMLDWADACGYVGFDSSAGFALPDGSIFSPDATAVSRVEWNALTDVQRETFLTLVPVVAIELVSPSDRPTDLLAKMRIFRNAGTAFVAVIDPYRKDVWIDGTSPPGFCIDLASFLT